MLAGRLRHRWQRCRLVPTAKRVPAVHCARKLPAPTELATHGYFGDAIRFSVSGNFRPDFGIGFMHQRHEIRCSQFADAAARDFCLTIANHPGCEDNGNPLPHQRRLLQLQASRRNGLAKFLCPLTLTKLPLTTRR